MKISSLETIRLAEFPNLLFVQVHTDTGLSGLGETFMGSRAVEAYLHETAAPLILGRDSRDIEGISELLAGYVGYASSGAEMRGKSAIDIALWDLCGKIAGLPLWHVLGGRSREGIRVYNTCAGYRYVRGSRGQHSDNWGLGGAPGPYEDLDAFLTNAGRLATSLLDQGITGMKIWPLDVYAEQSGGQSISSPDLEAGLEPFRQIRQAVGNKIEIMVELHGLWSFPAAQRICAALAQFDPAWIEDPIRPDDVHALRQLALATPVPIAAGETLATQRSFRHLLDLDAVSIAIVDLAWCGGVSEARKIAALAASYSRPVMFHDCTGPVTYAASTHLSLHAPNAVIQESVRAFYTGWYRDLVTVLPEITGGSICAPHGAGIGTELRAELRDRDDVTVTISG